MKETSYPKCSECGSQYAHKDGCSKKKQYYYIDSLVEDTMPEEVKRRYFELKSEETNRLSEMSEVLKWASENVFTVKVESFNPNNRFECEWGATLDNMDYYTSPTLYEALKKAWENREGK